MIWKIVQADRQNGHSHRTRARYWRSMCAAEAARIQHELLDILGQALTIREVDAGSCNGCELEINALGNPYYNLRAWASSLSPARATPTCCW